MKNNVLLKNLFITFNHSEGTQRAYVYALEKYATYFEMGLDELLSDAESEESKGIKWKHKKIKFRLLDFRQYLLENYALNTVKSVMINVIKFYKFYDVEIYELPKINEKSVQKPQPIYFSDLPDKKIIRDALGIASPVMKAVILFICPSGCARAECLSLTIQDYIDALSEYLPNKNMTIFEMIDLIDDDETIIPTFNIRRKKTNKYYTTYCSPEAVKAINAHILSVQIQSLTSPNCLRLLLIILQLVSKRSMMIWVLVILARTTDSEAICSGNFMHQHCTMTAWV